MSPNSPSGLLLSVAKYDREAFQRSAEPYRRELQLHCYRMLGSLSDAEDVVQETFVRAWRSISRFEGRSSLRAWLYKIATNTCINAAASRRRSLPEDHGPAWQTIPEDAQAAEIPWLTPYPDDWVDGSPGPYARIETKESVKLAFVAALQRLPARQRAVLLCCDVLGLSALETADVLDTSVASVNSALQRARAAVKTTPSSRSTSAGHAELLERYVRAWESSDFDGFIALLKEDAVLSMPPYLHWYAGRPAVRALLDWAWGTARGPYRMLRTSANSFPAAGLYCRSRSGRWELHALHALEVEDGQVKTLTNFLDFEFAEAFGLPVFLPS